MTYVREVTKLALINMETYPRFKTSADIFTKSGTYIKYCQLMVRE